MELKCYPVCECGYVFKEFSSYTELVEVSENFSREVRYFRPSICPKCKKAITSIIVPEVGYSGRIIFKD
ncbi:hypothetical protein EXN57_02080 [Clostridium botulinum]|nr:hypothetical protein [Clostridium botulinum]NFD33751.1 hypothetical protein [Clostridium botulinum]NFD57850.1 hypothetical protein [Clostridium botulinum]NFE00131.1 hypothetical protein [Clostridium botulinum]